MKIALVTMGTRGDVQPYIAVARALMARRHEVTLAASDEHESLIRAYGLEHKSMRGWHAPGRNAPARDSVSRRCAGLSRSL